MTPAFRLPLVILLALLLLFLISPIAGGAGFILVMAGVFFYVAAKAIRSGFIRSRPITDWSRPIGRETDPFGFWFRVTFCFLYSAGLICLLVYLMVKRFKIHQ
jgi:hypothetical protein